jgi:hypothetical protein
MKKILLTILFLAAIVPIVYSDSPSSAAVKKDDFSRLTIEASVQTATIKWSESINVAVRVLNASTIPQTIGTETCGVHRVSGWLIDEALLLDVNQGGSCLQNLVPPHRVVLKPGDIYEQTCAVSVKTGVRTIRPGPLTFRLGLQNGGYLPVWSNPVTVTISR